MKHAIQSLFIVLISSFVFHNLCFSQVTFNRQIIIQQTDNDRVYSVFPADLDNDGDMDILVAYYYSNKIAWLENSDGLGTFSTDHVITTEADGARCVCAADLDGDGDIDVLSGSEFDDKTAWYENSDGLGTFGSQQVITTQADGVKCIHTADLDGDGDLDVLSASEYDDKVAWYENVDGSGTFGPQQLINTTGIWIETVFSADLDGDGDMDVLSAYMGEGFECRIVWYENTDNAGTFSAEKNIYIGPHKTISQIVYSADLDCDGDMDVISASRHDGNITWYKNTDGEGLFGPAQQITTEVYWVRSICTADLDNDGDLDLLSASEFDKKIAWYENYNTKIPFGPQQVISLSADGAQCVRAADLDGDGDMDVLSASDEDARIVWYENLFLHTGIIEEQTARPEHFRLWQNYPNPFNAITRIRFAISERCFVRLKVYDLSGRAIETLVNEQRNPGTYDILWAAKALPSGIYLYRLELEDYLETRKLVLQR
ncbi:T9SS type A sorting domain-containing protein [bacterium]